MKFDICVGNPPYQGNGDPLYMRITKSIYDNNMDENSVMCMINPTALVDNKYEDSKNYKLYHREYEYLKLVDFYYDPSIRGTFTSVNINNDIGIFTYKKVNEEDKSIFSNWVKKRRFGDDYVEEEKIIKICKKYPQKMTSFGGYKNITFSNPYRREEVIETLNSPYYVVTSYNRGNQDKKTGGIKWDWTTVLNDINLVVQTNVINKRWNVFGFDDREEAIKWIKWLNTDFIQFLILFYKTQLSNDKILYDNLPQPPESGDFSDESLMEKFKLTEDQMTIIHNKITNREFGYRTKHSSYFVSDYNKAGYRMPSIELDGTEETLLKFIEELNRINDGVDASSYVPEEEEGQEEYSEIEYAEPEDSSPSGSEPSKTVLDN